MKKITLYRVIKGNGVTSVSPVKLEKYDSVLYRLVADDGKELMNGNIRVSVIDTDAPDTWTEVDVDVDETEDMKQALEILGVQK